MTDEIVYIGSTDGHVRALSAGDGTEQWSHETDDKVVLAPVVAGDMVYIVSHVAIPDDGPMANRFTSAVSTTDGSEGWSIKIARPMPSPALIHETV